MAAHDLLHDGAPTRAWQHERAPVALKPYRWIRDRLRELRGLHSARPVLTGSAFPPAPHGMTLYVVGDIHGCDHLLEAVHRRIDDDHRGTLDEKLEIYLGDYVNRGPNPARVIDLLIARASTHAITCIRGNHEELFEAYIDGALGWAHWESVGGLQTAISYGADPRLIAHNPNGFRDHLRDAVPAAHRHFLVSLGSGIVIGDYFFTHAGVRPSVRLAAQDPYDLRWIRGEFLDHAAPFEKLVVHGHTPVSEPDFRANRINIDTMAYATGRLTCLRLDGGGAHIIA